MKATFNGMVPPVHLAWALGEASLDKKFGGRYNWRSVTKNGKSESLVDTRLKKMYHEYLSFS